MNVCLFPLRSLSHNLSRPSEQGLDFICGHPGHCPSAPSCQKPGCPPRSSRLPPSLHLAISNAPGSATKATLSSPTDHSGLSLHPPGPGAPGPLLASQLPLLLTTHSHHTQLLNKHSLPCHTFPFRVRGFNPGSMRLWIEARGSMN